MAPLMADAGIDADEAVKETLRRHVASFAPLAPEAQRAKAQAKADAMAHDGQAPRRRRRRWV